MPLSCSAAASDSGAGERKRATAGVPDPGPGGGLWLCPCALDGGAAKHDPPGHAANARGGLALFATARRLFLRDGYREVGIDHFARPRDSLATARMIARSFDVYSCGKAARSSAF
ncbi:hypothetical protein [Leisingera methylohalidivorans]|uniref:hypothetical protein n=1 Tax=Leisingera methylohalidivorans TaxID=133924 RepID=UPI000400E158